ncbi:MAG: K+-dependent Na+/Ca+ exchanger related-protein [uncultured bacterium]|nr:MAG: K+-dependent Na+/Ca+ exchanger related-protein [uncultured bacterium]
MPALFYLLLIIIGCFALLRAVTLFIKATSKIAHHFHISVYTISFLLVSVATSLPETVVGITSAIDKNPILSFGNAVGSNIALLTIIIAIPVLIAYPITTRSVVESRDIYYVVFFSFLPIALLTDRYLGRFDGFILLSTYIIYIMAVIKRSTGFERLKESIEKINIWKEIAVFLFSLLLVLGASEIIVKSAEGLSVAAGWNLGFIGLTLIAVGTSMPEIAYTVVNLKYHHNQEILGNIVGSVVANSTLVLGVTVLIHPIDLRIDPTAFGLQSIGIFIIAMLIFLKFVRSKRTIDKPEAVFLLALYIVFLIIEYRLQIM